MRTAILEEYHDSHATKHMSKNHFNFFYLVLFDKMNQVNYESLKAEKPNTLLVLHSNARIAE